jgi:hypothetical protein
MMIHSNENIKDYKEMKKHGKYILGTTIYRVGIVNGIGPV